MKLYISILSMLLSFGAVRQAQAQETDTVATATILVKGISCAMDLPIIKKKLINQEGVDEVRFSEVKSAQSYFTIVYHTALIDEPKMRAIVEAAPSCDRPQETPYRVKSFVIDTIAK